MDKIRWKAPHVLGHSKGPDCLVEPNSRLRIPVKSSQRQERVQETSLTSKQESSLPASHNTPLHFTRLHRPPYFPVRLDL